MTGCTVSRYEQFETSPETIEQELQPAVCEQRQIYGNLWYRCPFFGLMIITSIFSVRQFYSLSMSLLCIALPGRPRYSQFNFSSNHDPDVCQSSNCIFSRSNYLSYTVETLTRNTPSNYLSSIIPLSFHSQLHLPHLQRTLFFVFPTDR